MFTRIRIRCYILEYMVTKIGICGFEFVGTDCNMWERIQNRPHKYVYVVTDFTLWPQVPICSHIFESVIIPQF